MHFGGDLGRDIKNYSYERVLKTGSTNYQHSQYFFGGVSKVCLLESHSDVLCLHHKKCHFSSTFQ